MRKRIKAQHTREGEYHTKTIAMIDDDIYIGDMLTERMNGSIFANHENGKLQISVVFAEQ